jgi:hypothetical protein
MVCLNGMEKNEYFLHKSILFKRICFLKLLDTLFKMMILQSVPTGVFDNLDTLKRDSLRFIDIHTIKWNKNPNSHFSKSSNITSAVISVDLDDSGKEMKN